MFTSPAMFCIAVVSSGGHIVGFLALIAPLNAVRKLNLFLPWLQILALVSFCMLIILFYIIPRFDLEFTVSTDLIAVSNGDLLYQVYI